MASVKRKVKPITTLADLTPDPHNANTGTERGGGLLERSLRETGAGRSILVDRGGHVICGGKTLEQWAHLADAARIKVVQTDGQDLVVVQREDLDLTDPQGLARKLAYYDNRTSELNLFWDPAEVYRTIQEGVDLSAFWTPDELETVIGQLQETGAKVPPLPRTDTPSILCPACGHLFTPEKRR